jgi:P4 family phage/plasmid primase-like protien
MFEYNRVNRSEAEINRENAEIDAMFAAMLEDQNNDSLGDKETKEIKTTSIIQDEGEHAKQTFNKLANTIRDHVKQSVPTESSREPEIISSGMLSIPYKISSLIARCKSPLAKLLDAVPTTFELKTLEELNTENYRIKNIPALWNLFSKSTPNVIKQLEENYLKLSLDGYYGSDVANANLFSTLFENILLCTRFKKSIMWYVRRGYHFEEDYAGIHLECAKLIGVVIRSLQTPENRNKTDFLKASNAIEGTGKIDSMLKSSSSDSRIKIEENGWNVDPYLLSVQNGILDLRTLTFVNANNLRIKEYIDIAFDPNSTAEKYWKGFCEIFQNNEELILWVMLYIGYTSTGYTGEQIFVICDGIGRNGKTKLLIILGEVMGTYHYTAPHSMLDYDAKNVIYSGEIHLQGKRFVTISELNKRMRLDERKAKALSGEEKITPRGLYEQFTTFEALGKIWFFTNDSPKIRDESDGMWRRVHKIPFHAKFEGANDNKHVIDEWRQEKSGILTINCIMAHLWIKFFKKNLLLKENLPDCMTTLKKEYQNESDMFKLWSEERTFQPDLADHAPAFSSTELYDDFCAFERDSGIREGQGLGRVEFGKRMINIEGVKRDRGTKEGKKRTLYTGIALKE